MQPGSGRERKQRTANRTCRGQNGGGQRTQAGDPDRSEEKTQKQRVPETELTRGL